MVKIKSVHVIRTKMPLTTLCTTFNSYLHFDNVALIFKYKFTTTLEIRVKQWTSTMDFRSMNYTKRQCFIFSITL